MKLKKLVVAAVWALAIAVWVGIISYYFIAEPNLKEWTIAVTAGAVALEIAFWTTAGVLGITLWQSRKAALELLMRPFRRNA